MTERYLARTDGWNCQRSRRLQEAKGIPINESARRDVESAAIGQQVLMFEAATGCGIDETFDRRLGASYGVPPNYSGRAFCRNRRADELRAQLCRYVSQVGLYAACLLKRAKTKDLPVMRATRFEL